MEKLAAVYMNGKFKSEIEFEMKCWGDLWSSRHANVEAGFHVRALECIYDFHAVTKGWERGRE